MNAGTLNINNAAALGAALGGLTINGGTLDNTSAAAITTNNYPLTINGDFTFTGTNDLNLGAGATTLGTAAGTARTITVSAGTLTLGGAIGDGTTANGIVKAGAGTLALTRHEHLHRSDQYLGRHALDRRRRPTRRSTRRGHARHDRLAQRRQTERLRRSTINANRGMTLAGNGTLETPARPASTAASSPGRDTDAAMMGTGGSQFGAPAATTPAAPCSRAGSRFVDHREHHGAGGQPHGRTVRHRDDHDERREPPLHNAVKPRRSGTPSPCKGT